MKQLTLIKIIHTIIWVFFNVVLFYLLYAVIINKIDKWMWIGLGSFVVEGIILAIFHFICPLTILARRYSDSTKYNFDIYLPEWLARYTKVIYSAILCFILLLLGYQLIFAG